MHPGWEGDALRALCGTDSVKARNGADNPKVALHWQVTEVGDAVELWGTTTVTRPLDLLVVPIHDASAGPAAIRVHGSGRSVVAVSQNPETSATSAVSPMHLPLVGTLDA